MQAEGLYICTTSCGWSPTISSSLDEVVLSVSGSDQLIQETSEVLLLGPVSLTLLLVAFFEGAIWKYILGIPDT